MARIALVSRLIDAETGGGLGAYVAAQAKVLATEFDVTVVTAESNSIRARKALGDVENVTLLFVDGDREPEVNTYFSPVHVWSASVLDVLREHYGDEGPDLIEFPDYHGEGVVTIQAARAGEPFLRRTQIVVRIHTSAEICSVLNGAVANDFASATTFSLERYCLREADRLLYAGGDIAETVRRFYSDQRLAPFSLVRHACGFASHPVPARRIEPSDDRQRLRLLYMGRLERRKGVQNLVRAMAAAVGALQLTIVGGDTNTGPLESSMRANLELGADMAGGIIKFLDSVPHSELAALIDAHDAIVVPSLWECWPYVALEALSRNRPVLATAVGGLREIVVDGESGLLSPETSYSAITDLLERAFAERDSLRQMVDAERPLRRFKELTNPQVVIDGYRRVIEDCATGSRTRGSVARAAHPLVSVVVPYFRMSRYIDETIASIRDQDYPNIETVIVNDGSFLPEDGTLERYMTASDCRVISQPNSGLGAARNFGIKNSRGKFILPLDADDTIEPGYVSRAVEVMRSNPQLAYVTCWTRYFSDDGQAGSESIGYQPLGTGLPTNTFGNVAGHAGSLIRRTVFDGGIWYCENLASHEDWEFYSALERCGKQGCVIPDRLYNYRIRPDSMLRTVAPPRLAQLEAERRANLVYRSVKWTH